MNFKKENSIAIILGLILVTVSNIIGHFAGPFSIMVTPILMTTIIAGINAQLYKSNFILTVIYNFGLLLFNDLFIRYYAGGTHDQEGKGWIALFFAYAFALAIITMIIYSVVTVDGQNKSTKVKNILTNISTVLVLTILTGLLYWYVIGDI